VFWPAFRVNSTVSVSTVVALHYVEVKIRLRAGLEDPVGGVEVWLYSFFNLGARWWVVSGTPRPLYPRERPGTHCRGGWVGLRAGLDGCGKCVPPHWDSIPGPTSPQRVAISTELYRRHSLLLLLHAVFCNWPYWLYGCWFGTQMKWIIINS